MNLKSLLLAGLVATLALPIRAAVNDTPAKPPATDRLLQQELRQEQIKTSTSRLGAQLDRLVEEYERNGLVGDDVTVLKAIRSVLGSLTDKEMGRVIELLQQARNAGKPGSPAALEAFAGQKGIVIQLRQLLLEFQRQQLLQQLSMRFSALAQRQGENLKEAVGLVTLARGRETFSFDESQRISLRIQETEQGTIGTEVGLLLKKLADLLKEMDGPTAERPQAAQKKAQDGQLVATLDSATTDLKAAKLLGAAGSERKARDLMQEIAKLLLPNRDTIEILKQAIRDVEKAIAEQKVVKEETQKLEGRKPDTAEVEKRQGEVVDKTASVRDDVKDVAPKAAEQLKSSEQKMQEARATLTDNFKTGDQMRQTAPEQQQQAVAKLEEAKKTLEDQLAKAEAQLTKPQDKLAAAKELLEKVKELKKQEEALKSEAVAAAEQKKPGELAKQAPKQDALKQETQKTQEQAAPTSPEAAESIAEAAKQMQKAEQQLAQQKPEAPMAQQAAVDALAKAEQQLEQKVASLEKAAEDKAKLEALSKKVGEIMKDQAKVQLDTAKAAEKPEAPSPKTADKQGDLAKQTNEAKSEAAPLAPKAEKPLASAEKNMAESKSELGKPNAEAARMPQKEAMADLAAAKKAIDEKIGQLANELGQQMQSNAAQAAEAVAKAQENVNQALAQLQQPAGIGEMIKEAQKEIAQALAKKAEGKPESAPVSEAKKSAQNAAQKLDQNDLKGAIGEMAKAQKSIEQAAQAGEPKGEGEPKGASQPKGEAKPGEGKPGEGKPGQGKPGEGKPGEGQPGGEPPPASLPQLAQKQADVKKLAELLSEMKASPAAQPLEGAAEAISPLAAGEAGQLPPAAQMSLQQALQALMDAAAQAEANKAMPAQANAQAAQQALAQAAASLALAQAGVGTPQAAQGQQPGQGQGQQPGNGKGQQPGNGKGQPQQPGQQAGKGDGKQGNWLGAGGADGAKRDLTGGSGFIGLPARDRAAIKQSVGEKYPEEFGRAVEQYLKNLSDTTSRPKGNK